MVKIFVLLYLLCSELFGQSHVIAKLISIPSNNLQIFSIEGKTFSCLPYGVITLGSMLQYKKINATCRKEMALFFAKNPEKTQFVARRLHVKSFYDLRYAKGECVIYASGQKSLSELLLENGLAILKANFQNEEFHALFLQSQRHAQENKLGVWSNNTLKICVLGLYKSF